MHYAPPFVGVTADHVLKVNIIGDVITYRILRMTIEI